MDNSRLVYNVLLFVNLLQISMISQPHNVLGSGRGKGAGYRSYTASTAAEQLALTFFEVIIALAFVVIAHFRGWECEALLLALVPAIAAWSLQEFFRRILYTEGRLAAAFLNDVISYGGQAAWIIAALVARPWQAGRFRALAHRGSGALCPGVDLSRRRDSRLLAGAQKPAGED